MSEASNLGYIARVEIDFSPAFAARLGATIAALVEPPSAADIQRMRNLLRDLEAIRSGKGPSARQLSTAPLLSGWRFALAPDGLRLTGEVTGHPHLGARPKILTSPVYAVGREFRWARVLSRFYRLGPPGTAPSATASRDILH